MIYMHREILNAPSELQVDHIDGNKLNNHKANLRLATLWQNTFNVSKRQHTTSIYKGVYWHKGANKWCAFLWFNQKYVYLGLHMSEVEAAKAYNEAATKYFGEFAKLNNVMQMAVS